MAHRVAWSPRAIEDLEASAQYISADSSAYAATVVKTILNTTRNLSRFPFAGRIVPELGDENIREWFAYSYRAIFSNRRSGRYHRSIVHGSDCWMLSDCVFGDELTPPRLPDYWTIS